VSPFQTGGRNLPHLLLPVAWNKEIRDTADKVRDHLFGHQRGHQSRFVGSGVQGWSSISQIKVFWLFYLQVIYLEKLKQHVI